MATDPGVVALARRQYGMLLRSQLLDLGWTQRMVDTRLRRGDWVGVERGLYRVATTPPSWEGTVLGACLVSGGVASHRCAASLWGWDTFSRARPEIVIPYERWYRPSTGVRVHRSTQFDRIGRCEVRAIPVTGAGRTAIDVAGVVSAVRLEHAVDSGIRTGHFDWPSLLDVLLDHSRQGRNGCGRLRRLLEHRYGDREIPLSAWSRMVACALVEWGVPRPTLEHRIVDDDGSLIAQVDLAYPSSKLAIELDSVTFHLNRRSFERDPRKRNRLRAMGWTVLEVTWTMYKDEFDGIVGAVNRLLG